MEMNPIEKLLSSHGFWISLIPLNYGIWQYRLNFRDETYFDFSSFSSSNKISDVIYKRIFLDCKLQDNVRAKELCKVLGEELVEKIRGIE